MARKIAAKHLRTGAWLAAGLGMLFSLVFHTYEPYLFHLSFLGRDILPYFIIAIAATISRTLAMAWISLVASFTILVVGVYAYIDFYRTAGTILNDFQVLFTDPLKWLIALIVLVTAISVLYIRRSQFTKGKTRDSLCD
jgi:hypothetical protein